MSYAPFCRENAQQVAKAQSPPKATAHNLQVGKPNDAFEQEAERIADQVMAGSASGDRGGPLSKMNIGAPLRRKYDCGGVGECEACKAKTDRQRGPSALNVTGHAPSIVHEVLRSAGRPLDQGDRNFFEPRFGHDFCRVRIHANAKAAESANAVGALAYTVGEDVVLATTRHNPQTHAEKRLLAHELAHVVQQRNPNDHSQGAELESRTAESPGAPGQRVGVQRRAPIGIQRQSMDDAWKYVQSGGARTAAQQGTAPGFANNTAAIIAAQGTPLTKSVEMTHWSSEEEKQRFIQDYIRYAKEHGLSKQYADAIAAYPNADPAAAKEPVTQPTPNVAARPSQPSVPPGIANLPKIQRPVATVEFKRLGFLGMGGLITVRPNTPSIQLGPDPTAGYNFDTYLVNMETGNPIPAQWLGGTRYRVLMGTPECPGCHFGSGIIVDLQGEHPLFILGSMALQAAPVLIDWAAARAAMAGEEASLLAKGGGRAGGGPPGVPPDPVPAPPETGAGGKSLKSAGKTTPGTGGNQPASARALAQNETRAASGPPLPAQQQEIADKLLAEHPRLNPEVAKDAARGGASAAGKGGKGADVPLHNGGGREVSVHQTDSPFTADSVGSHLQKEAMQAGTTEIYLQVNSTGATREGFLKMVPELRNAYLELRGKFVKIFGPEGKVWWSGTFGGPK